MKRTIALLTFFCLLLSGCGASSNETTPATTEAIASTNTEPTAATLTIWDMASVVENTLKEQYDDVTVTCDGNTVVIDLSYPGLASAVQDILRTRSDAFLDSWEQVVNSQKNLCQTILTNAKSSGIEGISVLLTVNNDQNPEKVFLIIFNDRVIYDIVNSQ